MNLIRTQLENGERVVVNPYAVALMRRPSRLSEAGKLGGVEITFINGEKVVVKNSLDQLMTLCGFPPDRPKKPEKNP